MKHLIFIAFFIVPSVGTYLVGDRFFPSSVRSQTGQFQLLGNLEYARVNGTALLLDLYLPRNAGSTVPVVVWIHGGGWVAGDKSLSTNSLQVQQTARGYAVASINYRLSGTAKFPAQIEDCKAAIRWLRANSQRYGLNPDRIAVWGSSAGGHLTALTGTSGGVAALEGTGGNLDQSSRVQAVVDWYGPTDLLKMAGQSLPCSTIDHDAATSPESQLLGCAVQTCPDKAASANPITHVSPDDPPFLIMHGTNDCTVPPGQSQLLHDALIPAGVETTLVFHQGAGHGGPQFTSQDSRNQIEAFLDKHLKSSPGPADFTLSPETSAKTVTAGGTAEIPISASSVGGTSQSVELTATVQPSTPFVSLSLSPTTISTGEKSVLTVRTTTETTAGTYTVTVTGRSGTTMRTASIALTVVRTASDTEAPKVTVLSPAAGLTVESRENASVEIVWQSSDNVGVASHSITFSGNRNGTPFSQAVASGLSGAATGFQLRITAGDAVRDAQVAVEAADAAGNKGRGLSGVFTVRTPEPPDTEKPMVTNLSLGKTKVKRKKDPTLAVSWQSRDNKSVVSHDVTYAENGVDFRTVVVSGLSGTTQAFTWTIPSAVPKGKTGRLKIAAKDAAGNVGEAVSEPFTVK